MNISLLLKIATWLDSDPPKNLFDHLTTWGTNRIGYKVCTLTNVWPNFFKARDALGLSDRQARDLLLPDCTTTSSKQE